MTNLDEYRACVGIMLINTDKKVFVGERGDSPGAWQMPQGGIDPGESVEQAGRRECLEEIGVGDINVLHQIDHWLLYDLPAELRTRLWGGKYRGQKQKWLLAQFDGTDADIDLERHGPPEFSAWQWVKPEQLMGLIVPFKRDIYRTVLREFAPWLS